MLSAKEVNKQFAIGTAKRAESLEKLITKSSPEGYDRAVHIEQPCKASGCHTLAISGSLLCRECAHKLVVKK